MRRLRAGELLGVRVVDRYGREAGSVQDIVVRHEEGVYTVLGLVLGRSALAGRFGYGDSLEPPTPWKHLLGWLRRHERYVKWEDVIAVREDRIEIGVDHGSLPRRWHEAH
ncbi:PRC-barrel domain-containing protein [Nocardiopsis changdeensis]|uniref:PRC-barrel domain-containing protein n=1 Tax=Nocardiopsis changdeensis TaxID=2831969 RepID=A0ABX8BF39_9ACTN|nr:MULTISPECIES: PRC-barrel domain-containing protein [Nocardiopsis]QUX20866.1 PRC-barrel domain-containing protein [Nocardiopsis changdeensis]QYX36798.1 PRC-barrel domain-containing protein [Nocardiopsis sp. MT53]